MNIIYPVVLSLFVMAQQPAEERDLAAQPKLEERDFATQLPVENVDVVIMNSLDAGRSEELLKVLFGQFKVKPRYALAVFPLPGEKKPRLVFIRGKDVDVALVKKALTAMDEASRLGAPETKGPALVLVDIKEVTAAEMRRRLVETAARAKLLLSEEDFIIYPEGESGSLFFIGDPELADRVAEMSMGLDRAEPSGTLERAKIYAHQLWGETVKAFGGLFSTVLSAVALLLLHLILCHLPFMGSRYKRSFRLFWEKLFASFKGQDLAWEIIKAAAELGVASTAPLIRGQREAAAGAVPSAVSHEVRERAIQVASTYIRWRGIDAESPEVQALLEAAIDAEDAKSR
ncbi:MAG: hypothetical protein NTX71_07720 [Candidatus Aureabacteria bacterium]|nr:hypothetical protein [Candidatus Auribacterota bacterium]